MQKATLQEKLLRGLRSGAVFDYTTRNMARALKVNIRAVRRELNAMRAAGIVRAEQRCAGAPIEWSAT